MTAGSHGGAPRCSGARGERRLGAAELGALAVRRVLVDVHLATRGQEDHAGDDERRGREPRHSEEHVERAHRTRTAAIQNAPAARMDGTQRPTNTPSSRWSVNQSAIERRNEARAAIRKSATPVRCLLMPMSTAAVRRGIVCPKPMTRPRPASVSGDMERVADYPRPPAVAPCARRVRLELAGEVLADSTRALRVL